MRSTLTQLTRLLFALPAFGLMVASLAAVPGCETVEGAGEDVQEIGETGQDVLQDETGMYDDYR